MKELYEKSLQMIKRLNIKTEEEYNNLHKNFLILSVESLKYISQQSDFSKVIEYANNIDLSTNFDKQKEKCVL